MKLNSLFFILFLPISTNFGSQPSLDTQYWQMVRMKLQYSHATELEQRRIGKSHKVIVTGCAKENVLILYGRADEVQTLVSFIETQIDLNPLEPVRLGNNIISKKNKTV